MSELAGKTVDAVRGVLAALPPSFVMLCLINAGFLSVVMWFLNVQLEQRMTLANKILDVCLTAGLPK